MTLYYKKNKQRKSQRTTDEEIDGHEPGVARVEPDVARRAPDEEVGGDGDEQARE